MTRTQKSKLYFCLQILIGVMVASACVLYALRQNIDLFLTPSKLNALVEAKGIQPDKRMHLGGLVKAGSVKRQDNAVTFVVTDLKQEVPVYYVGLLPDLFHENKGVVTQGHLRSDGVFIAQQVLAKHDENYMPPAIASEIAKQHKTNDIQSRRA